MEKKISDLTLRQRSRMPSSQLGRMEQTRQENIKSLLLEYYRTFQTEHGTSTPMTAVDAVEALKSLGITKRDQLEKTLQTVFKAGTKDVFEVLEIPYAEPGKIQPNVETVFTKAQILDWFERLGEESSFTPTIADVETAIKEGKLPDTESVGKIVGMGVRKLVKDAQAKYQLRSLK